MKKRTALREARFIKSVFELEHLPAPLGKEVAFWGRSNVGKSSLMNRLMQAKDLVKVSKTPGCTQSVNFFQIGSNLFLVDLPGYGYAKVPHHLQVLWIDLVSGYLATRENLRHVFLLLDSRHELKDLDQQAIEFLASCRLSFSLVLTKVDKISDSLLAQHRAFLQERFAGIDVYSSSAEKGWGMAEIQRKLMKEVRV